MSRIFSEEEWADLMRSVESEEIEDMLKAIYAPEEISEQMNQDLGDNDG